MGVCWRGHDVMAIGWKSHRPSESRSDARHHPNSDNNSTPTAFLYLYTSFSQLCIATCPVTPNPGTSDYPLPERIVTQLFLTNSSNRLGNGTSGIVLGMMQTYAQTQLVIKSFPFPCGIYSSSLGASPSPAL